MHLSSKYIHTVLKYVIKQLVEMQTVK
jgi:hypothetical protein